MRPHGDDTSTWLYGYDAEALAARGERCCAACYEAKVVPAHAREAVSKFLRREAYEWLHCADEIQAIAACCTDRDAVARLACEVIERTRRRIASLAEARDLPRPPR